MVPLFILIIACDPAQNTSLIGSFECTTINSDSLLAERVHTYSSTLANWNVPLPGQEILLCTPQRKHLGWSFFTKADGSVFVSDSNTLNNLINSSLEKDIEYSINEVLHFPLTEGSQSPLVSAASGWSDSELIFWLISEGFRQKGLKVNYFYNYKAAETAVSSVKGIQAIEVAEIKRQLHDHRTWALLCDDLIKQISQLDDSAADYLSKREKVYNAWIREYNDNYANRFLTNKWKDFTNIKLNDSDLLILDTSPALWNNLDKAWDESTGDLAIFTNMLLTQEGL